ncbi:MAG: Maf family protein [Eubacteriaceae bacterium]|nr:Maf family protein [Eubacteriaceae bacterium]
MKKKIILASGSPRRIEMMKKNGYDPLVFPAQIDEVLPEGIGMRDAVMFLSLKKALWVEERIQEDAVIIAADTVVYKDGILGKPADREDAKRMLEAIKNTGHYVTTGVTIIDTVTGIKKVFCDVTEVFCKNYSQTELNAYLDSREPYDKAGAYAIQGIFRKYIDHYNGSFDNVVGFPWELIAPELEKMLKE